MVHVKKIVVKKDRVSCLVQVDGPDLYSSPALAKILLEQMPTLADHNCKNAQGEPFAHVLEHTSIPHVLEHIIIDYQVLYNTQRQEEEPCGALGAAGTHGAQDILEKPVLGTTEWLNKPEGVAKIDLSFFDDIIAFKAISKAQEVLNQALSCA